MRVPSTTVQNNFGKYLKFAQAGEEVIVTKKGKDVVRITTCLETNPEAIMEAEEAYYTGNDRVSYEEYLELVEQSDQRYELINGVVYNLASPVFKHQKAVAQLFTTFSNWFKDKQCTPLTSPFDVTLHKSVDNICVVQPDILILCDVENVDQHGKYHGVPDLVVEVLSPSTQNKDLLTKLELYQQCSVREYWIVDPNREQIMVYALEDNEIRNYQIYKNQAGDTGDTVQSFHFNGLKILLSQVFA